MENWVSIDFGTCNSAAAIIIDGKPKMVSHNNLSSFPTAACVLSRDSIVVCDNASNFKRTKADRYFQEFKLQIADPMDCDGVGYRRIVAEILKHIKGYAEIENNDIPINNVLLTVPVVYTKADPRKIIMQQAAYDAGFTRVEFLSESKAAAYHYYSITGGMGSGISLIYDLGGGTFDPALIEMMDSNEMAFLGSDSGIKCGGQFFDAAIYKAAKEQCNLQRDSRWIDYETCKKLKEGLSVSDSLQTIFSNDTEFTLSRQQLNSLIQDKINLTLNHCDAMLKSANKEWADISQVLLVGGSTSIPLVKEMLQNHLNSHQADLEIIRSKTGCGGGEYNHNYAVVLGGISYVNNYFMTEEIAVLVSDNSVYQLKEGCNSFGQGSNQDFSLTDPAMSPEHFIIDVSKNSSSHYEYSLTTISKRKPTIVGMIALDKRYAFSPQNIILREGDIIVAGSTRFNFKK